MDLLDDPGKRSCEFALGMLRHTLRIIMEATSEGLACFPVKGKGGQDLCGGRPLPPPPGSHVVPEGLPYS